MWRTTSLRMRSSWRERSLAHRSTSRWRYRVSTSLTPCHLSPKLRRASARSVHSLTMTESSPRLVRTTSPRAPIQSPRFNSTNSSKRSVSVGPREELHRARRVAQLGERGLPLITQEHDPAGHPDGDAGLLSGGDADHASTTAAVSWVRSKR